MSVISHITFGTNDKERSAKFYDAVLGAIGFARLPKPPEKPLAYEKNGQMPTVYIYTPEGGRPATWGNGTLLHLSQIKGACSFVHDEALKAGKMSEGEPGPRPPLWRKLPCCLCARSRWQQTPGRLLRGRMKCSGFCSIVAEFPPRFYAALISWRQRP